MMEPKVREMIVCEDVTTRKGSSGKIDILGLINKAIAPIFPINLSFCVYLCLANGRGSGQGRIVVAEAESEEAVYLGDFHSFDFGPNPLSLRGFTIRIPSCELPGPGLYLVRFVYNEVVLEERVLLAEKR